MGNSYNIRVFLKTNGHSSAEDLPCPCCRKNEQTQYKKLGFRLGGAIFGNLGFAEIFQAIFINNPFCMSPEIVGLSQCFAASLIQWFNMVKNTPTALFKTAFFSFLLALSCCPLA